MSTSAVMVLLSGGQDSTTCLYWALDKFKGDEHWIAAVSFAYGQRHQREVMAAMQIANLAGVQHRVVDVHGMLTWSESALIKHDEEIHEKGELPTSFVPGRNALFLTLAAGMGYELCPGRINVVGGMCETDYSGYPDCREEFVMQQTHALALALGRGVSIHTPLMHISKAATVRMAHKLPGCWEALKHTVTCYQGGEVPCGECPACKLRAKGFEEAGLKDPALDR